MARDIKTGSVSSELFTKLPFQKSAASGAIAPGTTDTLVIPTNLLPSAGFIWDIQGIEFNFDVTPVAAAAGGVSVEIALCRNTKAAMPNMNDLDVIGRTKIALITTAAGTPVMYMDMPISLQWVGDAIVAQPSLFLVVTPINCTVAGGASYSGLITYKAVALAKERILEILYG